jgi:hypothetical protein
MNDNPEYDPIIQIEKVIEKSRKDIDQAELPCKSALLLNALYRIKEQLEKFIVDSQDKLKTELSGDDLKYYTFALAYYQKQLDFVKSDITILEETSDDSKLRVDYLIETFKTKHDTFYSFDNLTKNLSEQHQKNKNRRNSLWTNILDVVGRQ